MRSRLLINGLLFFMMIAMTSCVSNKKFKALEEENQSMSQELSDIKSQLDDLQGQNASLTSENSELTENLSSVEQKLNQTESRVTQVEKEAAEKKQELDALNREIAAAFADINNVVSSTDAKVKEMQDALYLDLQDTISFRTGSASISADDTEAIERIANLLNDHPNLHLVIEGNTDKRSINNDNYADNWELSAARSINVVRKLVDMGVNPAQLTAAGRADHNPAETNDPDSKATLAKNRRVELMVIPKVGTLYKMQD